MLLNESLGGFSVLVSGPPKIGANEKAQLSSYRGSFDVRIVHAREIVPATPVGDAANVQAAWAEEEDPGTVTTADIDGFPGPGGGPWFRLGIRCLREIAPALSAHRSTVHRWSRV